MAQLPPAKMSYCNFNFPQPQLPNQTQPSAQGLASAPAAAQALTAGQAPTDTSVMLAVHEPAPSTVPSNSTCLPESLMYKNRLQEYAQKSGIQLPVYHTINEGFQHSPRFRSTVHVDGAVFTSPNTFSHRKTAEQSAAKIALESVLKKMKDEGCPLIYVDVMFCKSILNEFAVKMNMEKPRYNTIRQQGQLPVFVSSLSFNGVLYTADPSKNKKEAEQMAARAVILSLLGKSETKTVVSEIIRSKVKHLATFNKVKQPCNTDASIVSSMINIGHNANTVPEKDKGVEAAVVVNAGTTGGGVQPVSVNSVPTSVDSAAAGVVVNAGTTGGGGQPVSVNSVPTSVDSAAAGVVVNAGTTGGGVQPVYVNSVPTSVYSAAAGVVAEASSGNRPHHEFGTVKSEPFPGVNNLPDPNPQAAIRPIEFVHATAEQPTGDGQSSAKRRRRSRKKANKRIRTDAQLSIATLPLNQAPACSVAQ